MQNNVPVFAFFDLNPILKELSGHHEQICPKFDTAARDSNWGSFLFTVERLKFYPLCHCATTGQYTVYEIIRRRLERGILQ